MDELLELTLFIIVIFGFLILINERLGTSHRHLHGIIRDSVRSHWGLQEFLRLPRSQRKIGKWFMFSEQTVYSMGHKFTGRFDQAVLHWGKSPILDLMIERKFPVSHLPMKRRDEDLFQAALYSLALMESGVSCSSSRLVVIYCLQNQAKRCLKRTRGLECFKCGAGRVFHEPFSQRTVLSTLERLDEVWYNGRRPIPDPSFDKCMRCQFSRNGSCQYTLA
ncbi:MAG: hypothetical protein JSW61_09840 [Candidatus Thorarchaeota archaeon]|nr:MAG: hypothetical protein JSW61_09840 [Candidatus Thorarchaeota archaeon]